MSRERQNFLCLTLCVKELDVCAKTAEAMMALLGVILLPTQIQSQPWCIVSINRLFIGFVDDILGAPRKRYPLKPCHSKIKAHLPRNRRTNL